jgi:hypothetical protein
MAPIPDQPLPYPSGVSGLDLITVAASQPTAPLPPPAAAATALSFSGPLKDSAIASLPAFDGLHEASLGELQPARFLLGVSDRGQVQYVFLQDSSGDKTLDTNASRALEQVHFRPSAASLTWGFATFYWGSAVYARPTAVPEAAQ